MDRVEPTTEQDILPLISKLGNATVDVEWFWRSGGMATVRPIADYCPEGMPDSMNHYDSALHTAPQSC
jgi:hypothetical protein